MTGTAIRSRAAFYERGGRISIEEITLPPLQRGELLLRMRACGICASETMSWYADAKAPFVIGHEPVGTVESSGSGAPAFEIGSRVFVHHHTACMSCPRCLRGDHVQCDGWSARTLFPGGVSQYAIAAATAVASDVLALPDSISDEAATLIEPLATVVKSARRSGLRKAGRLLVVGLGVMGMLHMLLARHWGVKSIMGADRCESRVRRALDFGAHEVFNVEEEPLARAVSEATGGDGADVVIVGPGSVQAIEESIACVAAGGTLLLFSPPAPHESWPMPVNHLYFKDISIVSSYSAGPYDTREALGLLAAGLNVGTLFTHRFPLDGAAQAYGLVRQAKEALKVLVYPNELV